MSLQGLRPDAVLAAIRHHLTRFLPVMYALIREIKAGGLDYRAMSLVYTTLLALIPLLAVSFSVLKSFGAETYLEPFLREALAPMGERAGDAALKILDTVKRLRVGVLGFVGVVFLFYASASLLEKLEESFNHIWRVRASRSVMRRFADYISFTLLGPWVVFSAFGGMSGLLEHQFRNPWLRGSLGLANQGLHALLPYIFIIATFSAAYLYIPNVNVRPRAALIGGFTAGLAWKFAGWGFAAFVSSSAQYSALYSSFAILALFMIWLYVSWLILLMGAQVAVFSQHPRYIRLPPGQVRLSGRLLEQLGLAIMIEIGGAYLKGAPAWTLHRLAERFDLPEDSIEQVLAAFAAGGLLLKVDPRQMAYLPARDLSSIRLIDVLDILRGETEAAFMTAGSGDLFPDVTKRLQREIEDAVARTLTSRTLREICDATDTMERPG